MSNGFSKEPIEGEEAQEVREMMREWSQFKRAEMEPLRKISWMMRNWKLLALIAIIGAAGQFNKVLETMKAWIS